MEYNTLQATAQIMVAAHPKQTLCGPWFVPSDVLSKLPEGHKNNCSHADVLRAFRELAARGFAEMDNENSQKYRLIKLSKYAYDQILSILRTPELSGEDFLTAQSIVARVLCTVSDIDTQHIKTAVEFLILSGMLQQNSEGSLYLAPLPQPFPA